MRLRNGLEAVFLDRHNGLLTLWLMPDARRESGVGLVQVWLNPQQSERVGGGYRDVCDGIKFMER